MFYEEMIGQHKFLDIKYFHEHSNISLVDIPNRVSSSYCECILMGVKK